jgi:hypothetical protein
MMREMKERYFLIMDGSDKNFVRNIIGYVEMAVGNIFWYNKLKWFKRVKCHNLDRNHPSIKVVTVKSTYRDYCEVRKFLTEKYPEQCIFDVNLNDVKK